MGRERLQHLAVSETGFIFDPHSGRSYTVNSTGYSILQHLKSGLEKDEIVEKLIDEYEVSPAEAERDVIDFLEALKALHLT
ncbi:MAG: PqqD family protein [Candidatus Hydrogenedentota bacterium]|nr:MAG: PqqD family protein [Candidatus Hydrogenedentota bacterium]